MSLNHRHAPVIAHHIIKRFLNILDIVRRHLMNPDYIPVIAYRGLLPGIESSFRSQHHS